MNDRKIIITHDGTSSLLVEHLGETFHSIHGAKTEADHVYIKNGLLPCLETFKENIQILELGFGSGLNAMLTAIKCQSLQRLVNYTGLEAYPLQENEWVQLKFDDKHQDLLSKLHTVEWEKEVEIHSFFNLIKRNIRFEHFSEENKYHMVYYDVFGYNYQPELWNEYLLKTIYEAMLPGGRLVTYACKGIVNRRLKNLGFQVYKLSGPPGKREMTVAVKI